MKKSKMKEYKVEFNVEIKDYVWRIYMDGVRSSAFIAVCERYAPSQCEYEKAKNLIKELDEKPF